MVDAAVQVFNNIVVVGPGGVSAEAFIAEGSHSVHGAYGRVSERVTSTLVTTNREALVLANHILDQMPCWGEILQGDGSSSQWACRCPSGDS